MDRLVLIGSRATAHFRDDSDYDLVGTQKSAFVWLAQLDRVELQQAKHPFDPNFVPSVEKDLKQWKFDKKHAQKIWQSLMAGSKSICKCRGIAVLSGQPIKFEIEIVSDPHSSSHRILEYCQAVEPHRDGYVVAPLEVLEAVKSAHIIFPHGFQKHIEDLHRLRHECGYASRMKIRRSAPIQTIYLTRRIETMLRLGVPGDHLDLNKTSEDFLEKDEKLVIKKYIPHDDIHLLVAANGCQPAYHNLRKNISKAFMDFDLFRKAKLQQRLSCVFEECMAIAIERYLLTGSMSDADQAYLRALQKVCTSLTKGWFREFAINYYPRVKTLPRDLWPIVKEIQRRYQGEEDLRKIMMGEYQQIGKLETPFVTRTKLIFRRACASEAEQEMVDQLLGCTTSFLLNNAHDVWYQTKFKGLDLIYTMMQGYDEVHDGWCMNTSKWGGMIAVCDSQYKPVVIQYWNEQKAQQALLNWESPFAHTKFCALHFILEVDLDDSYSDRPDPFIPVRESIAPHLKASNPLLRDEDFIMRYITSVAFAPPMEEIGDYYMPEDVPSDQPGCGYHSFYRLWAKNKSK